MAATANTLDHYELFVMLSKAGPLDVAGIVHDWYWTHDKSGFAPEVFERALSEMRGRGEAVCDGGSWRVGKWVERLPAGMLF